MGLFIDYIQHYLQDNSSASFSVNWWDLYKDKENFVRDNEFYEVGNDDFKKIVSEIPHSLTRNDIFTFFEKDYYKGYVSSMLWGGIGLRPSKKEYMNSAFSVPKTKIIEIIENLKNLLGEGNIRDAFLSMSQSHKNKGNKIPGVGLSYFTKLLFFLGNESMNVRPLIYDAQLQKVHSALIKDELKELNTFFTIRSFSMDDSLASIEGGHFEGGKKWEPVDYYLDFVKRMADLANNNNEISTCITETGKQGKSGRLEEMLFGYELSRKKGENDPAKNPRAFVSDYLGLSNFAEEIKDKSEKAKKTFDSKKAHRKSQKKEDAERRPERKKQPTEAASMNISDEFINNIRNQYPNFNISRDKPISHGPKAALIAGLPESWTLAVGIKKTSYFCGLYKNERSGNPYPDIFDKQVKSGYYKKYLSAQEALNQFEDILRKENEKQHPQSD